MNKRKSGKNEEGREEEKNNEIIINKKKVITYKMYREDYEYVRRIADSYKLHMHKLFHCLLKVADIDKALLMYIKEAEERDDK